MLNQLNWGLMKSLQQIKEETELNYEELANAFRSCISYFLSDEELESFLIQEKENKINMCHSKKVRST